MAKIPQEVRAFVISLWEQGLSRKEIAQQVREQFGFSPKEFTARTVNGILLSEKIHPTSDDDDDIPSLRIVKSKDKDKEDVVDAVHAGKEAFKEGMEAAAAQTNIMAQTASTLVETAKKVSELNKDSGNAAAVLAQSLTDAVKTIAGKKDDSSAVVLAQSIQAFGQQISTAIQAAMAQSQNMLTTMKDVIASQKESQKELRQIEEERAKTFYEQMGKMFSDTMKAQSEMLKERLQVIDQNFKTFLDMMQTVNQLLNESIDRERKHLDDLRELVLSASAEEKSTESQEQQQQQPWWSNLLMQVVTRGLTAFERTVQQRQLQMQGMSPMPHMLPQQTQPQQPIQPIQQEPAQTPTQLGGDMMGIFDWLRSVGATLASKALPPELKELVKKALDSIIRKAKIGYPPEEGVADLFAISGLLENEPKAQAMVEFIFKQACLYRFDELLNIVEKFGIDVTDLKPQVDEAVLKFWDAIRTRYIEMLRNRVDMYKQMLEQQMQQQGNPSNTAQPSPPQTS